MPKRIRVAIIESPDPIDAFEGRTEAQALEATCKLLGHKPLSFFARSRSELQTVCNFLASADSTHASKNDNAPLFIHISCHGNNEGLGFGHDTVSWSELAEDLIPIFKNKAYRGQTVLCLSACDSDAHQVHTHLREKLPKKGARPPAYIISTRQETAYWDDLLVAWTLFYHKIGKLDLSDFGELIDVFDSINECVQVQFLYRRWNDETQSYKSNPMRSK
ncbi:hypothetical protein [Burkholderia gladioli]|uniref:hypothetical protein n=1 Tax=Burkholderia gladioli TaxID=28095 RepID=UPI00164051F8|nr:hypothetical protein [Burkholderia gladioli]